MKRPQITASLPSNSEHYIWSDKAAWSMIGQTIKYGKSDALIVSARTTDNPSLIEVTLELINDVEDLNA